MPNFPSFAFLINRTSDIKLHRNTLCIAYVPCSPAPRLILYLSHDTILFLVGCSLRCWQMTIKLSAGVCVNARACHKLQPVALAQTCRWRIKFRKNICLVQFMDRNAPESKRYALCTRLTIDQQNCVYCYVSVTSRECCIFCYCFIFCCCFDFIVFVSFLCLLCIYSSCFSFTLLLCERYILVGAAAQQCPNKYKKKCVVRNLPISRMDHGNFLTITAQWNEHIVLILSRIYSGYSRFRQKNSPKMQNLSEQPKSSRRYPLAMLSGSIKWLTHKKNGMIPSIIVTIILLLFSPSTASCFLKGTRCLFLVRNKEQASSAARQWCVCVWHFFAQAFTCDRWAAQMDARSRLETACKCVACTIGVRSVDAFQFC